MSTYLISGTGVSSSKPSAVYSTPKLTLTKQRSRRNRNLEQDLIDILDDDEDDDIIETISKTELKIT